MSAIPNVKKILQKLHIADTALVFKNLTEQEQKVIFSLLLSEGRAAELLSHLEVSESALWLSTLPKDQVVSLLKDISSDDRVDIMSALPEELAEEILSIMNRQEQEEISSLLEFGHDTAGGIMTPEYFALPEDRTVNEAIEAVKGAEKAEMVFYVYVVDDRNHLVGVVSLRQLLITRANPALKDIMNADVISVSSDIDQEEVARLVQRYDLVSIPVVDEENKLIGVVTVDDVIDVIRDENTEDWMKMAGTSEEDVKTESGLLTFRLRLPWLLTSWIGGVISVFIIGYYEESLKQIAAVAAFIPVIIGMGGNAGTQSSSVAVRGLALGRIHFEQIGRYVFREIQVGLLLGITYGVLLGVLAGVSHGQIVNLGIAVGFAICVAMVLATLLGSLIPILLHKFSIDPALATGPFVTTSMDVLGIICYFLIATWLMPGF